MVDINLIGDDKTGEEDRVEDFTQTSSMDTQELAFEERTETFDTTKTAGFAKKRSYSPLISTLIILAVIILLGSAVYFFVLDGKSGSQGEFVTPETEQSDIDDLLTENPADEFDFDDTGSEGDLTEPQEDVAEQAPVDEGQTASQLPPEREIPEEPVVEEPVTRSPARTPETTQPPTPPARATIIPVSAAIDIQGASQTVTSLMNSIPSGLSGTLLSYTGNQVRFEFVANDNTQAQGFTDELRQFFAGSMSVLSEGPVASNGQSFQRVLVAGEVNSPGATAAGAVVMNLQEANNWVSSTCGQLGLTLREINSQASFFSDGYEKTPVQVRIYGAHASILSFLREIASAGLNLELVKLLVVSPDVVYFSDDSLVLVMNMYLYEPA